MEGDRPMFVPRWHDVRQMIAASWSLWAHRSFVHGSQPFGSHGASSVTVGSNASRLKGAPLSVENPCSRDRASESLDLHIVSSPHSILLDKETER
jgi:hypothetical protein